MVTFEHCSILNKGTNVKLIPVVFRANIRKHFAYSDKYLKWLGRLMDAIPYNQSGK